MEFGDPPKKIEFDVGEKEDAKEDGIEERVGKEEEVTEVDKKKVIKPPSQDEYLWVWKVGSLFCLKICERKIIF